MNGELLVLLEGGEERTEGGAVAGRERVGSDCKPEKEERGTPAPRTEGGQVRAETAGPLEKDETGAAVPRVEGGQIIMCPVTEEGGEMGMELPPELEPGAARGKERGWPSAASNVAIWP